MRYSSRRPSAAIVTMLAAMLAACQTTGVDGPGARLSAEQTSAVERARLAAQRIQPGEWRLESVEPDQWPDSALGCPQSGVDYLPVVTSGHAVWLASGQRRVEVHVAGESAIVCRNSLHGLKLRTGGAMRARNLEQMEETARTDLAARLGIDVGELPRTVITPVQWPDTSLGCPQPGEQVVQRVTPGYRFTFTRQGRIYEYHTDLARVIACPPIELQ